MFQFKVVPIALAIVSICSIECRSWQQLKLVGEHLPLIVVTPATGSWAAKHPYDPQTFGKIRGFVPDRRQALVVIFCDGLDAAGWKILSEISQLFEMRPESCYVTLFDIKGAQVGGYDPAELDNRIKELKQIAQKEKAQNVSIAIAANNGEYYKKKVGLEGSHNVLITILGAITQGDDNPPVESVILVDTKTVDQQKLQQIRSSINGVLSR